MSLAKKLKEVVAANFVEISRQDKESETAKEERQTARHAADDTLRWDPAAVPTPLESGEDLLLPAAESEEASFVAARDVMEATIADVRASQDEAGVAEPAEEEPVAADPLSLVGENGAVDFDAVFTRGDVPRSTAFTAEQALSMLLSMPSDLPLRVKRLTVKATLDAVGQAVGAAPADIVADAERKKGGLERYIEEVTAYAAEVRAEKEAEIARLRACIADVEGEIVGTEKRRDAAIVATRERVDQFDQVVAFFTVGGGDGSSEQADSGEHADDAELPPFLREEAVMRLLGIDSGSEEAAPTARVAETAA